MPFSASYRKVSASQIWFNSELVDHDSKRKSVSSKARDFDKEDKNAEEENKQIVDDMITTLQSMKEFGKGF